MVSAGLPRQATAPAATGAHLGTGANRSTIVCQPRQVWDGTALPPLAVALLEAIGAPAPRRCRLTGGRLYVELGDGLVACHSGGRWRFRKEVR